MMHRRHFVHALGAASLASALPAPSAAAPPRPTSADDRAFWVGMLDRIARPVLENLAAGRLQAVMPVETKPGADRDRTPFTYLEAFGRTMAGIAPWLALEADASDEGRLRARYVGWAHDGLRHLLDPTSPDYVDPAAGPQILVDAAFLAHAVLRAPDVLWAAVPAETQRLLVEYLVATRQHAPYYNNWLLFSGMVEAALLHVGEPHDAMRIDYGLKKHAEWYVGDGHFSDGPEFHWDYYNSFVIQPFLLDVLAVMAAHDPERYEPRLRRQRAISQRYGAVQERLIAPDGTYPPIGRSITYRFGAFQLLAQLALQGLLPEDLTPGQVRSGLTAVIQRTAEAPSLFDADGWLTLGLYGHQPDLAETYISTGSQYLCCTAFLPLGLPPDAPFWSEPDAPWTAKRIWSGDDLPNDSALKNQDLP